MDLNEDTKMDSSSGSSSEEETYDVEKIVSHKKSHGKLLYRIRWVNYDENADTWEPESNLLGDAAQTLLKEYKEKHGIDTPKSNAKSKGWAYVSDNEEESKKRAEWLVSSTDKRAEIRNLYVPDRILDDTEEFFAHNDSLPRLTRAQLKTIHPTTKEDKKRSSTESAETPKERRGRKKRLKTESSSEFEQPKKPKTAKPKKIVVASDSEEEKPVVVKPQKPKPIPTKTNEDAVVKEKPLKVPQKPMVASTMIRSSPKKPVSMLGKDPKQSVTARHPGESTSKSLSTFRIPKKQHLQPTKQSKSPQKPEIKKIEPPKFNNNSFPRIPIKQKVSTSSTENPSLPTASLYKAPQWKPAESEKIREKECILPGTRLGLNATLNIDPTQLTSYQLLSTDVIKVEKISQQEFNQAVLSGKIATVRAALRNKVNAFDMDSSDLRGKTLLHRLAELNCDQQHSQDEIMDCLVNAGASMSITENEYSRTPLHLAVISRRSCHVRKLIELGSPINTVDSRNESPLITTLKMNNIELSKYLLNAGATYQSAFSQKLNLSKTQQKPVTNYQNSLQECILKALQAVSFDIKNFVTLSPVFQTALYESHQLDFVVNGRSDINYSNTCPILVTALVDNSDRDRMTASVWGETPVDSVYLNGQKLEYAQEGNKFVYFITALGPQNPINISMDRSRAQYSKRLLAAQLFGFRMDVE